MKAIYLVTSLFFIYADAVINNPTQEAQRREAPAQHQQYGPPKPNVPSQEAIRQHRIQAMQRLVAAMRNGGYASSAQGRVVNRPRPIPLAQPQNSYGPPKNSYGPPPSSSSGSLANFMNSHSPDVKCDGWIPIPGPSVGSAQIHSSGGAASSGASIDSSYGPPRHGSGNSGLNTQIVVIPEDTYGPPPPIQPLSSYGVPDHGHSSSGGSSGHSLSLPSNSYGPPDHGHSSSGGSSGHSLSLPSNSYGPSDHGHSSGGGSSGHSNLLDDSYGPPPPAPVYNHESHSDHSSHSSVSSVSSIGHATYGPPEIQSQPKIPGNTYGPPQAVDTLYGAPSAPESNFGVSPESSYGPPPSGNVHSDHHGDIQHSSQGHAGNVQGFGQDLQLPEIDPGAQFNNAIGLVTSSLGVSAGHSEVVQSHAIHESHTQELTNNFNGGDSYSAPPLDSYEPGKYAPSFLKPRPQQPHSSPVNFPQRPLPPRPHPAPQYKPPIPMKLFRPQGPPPPSYRPQINSHAQSIAQGYSSGQSNKQSFQSSGPVRQQPIYPLPHRAPVPQGLFQSIGHNVQALDNGQRGHSDGNTYLPPPTSELPIKLNAPNPAPAQNFLTQHQSHDSGSSASSSASYSFQNQELRNVHIIHDCGKGPQLSQGYAGSTQNFEAPTQSYGAPAQSFEAPSQNYGTPAQDYGTPLGQPLTSYEPKVNSQLQELSSNYEIPSGDILVPQHNSIDFNSQSNSYGPPASGPATDVIGLESQRANTVVSSEHQNIASVGSNSDSNDEPLPGLSSGLSSSGLNFISAQKSHSIEVPSQRGQVDSYQLQFTSSVSDHGGNQLDAQNHDNILADGLLNSIISAIEKKPIQTVPQVIDDLENDHSEVQVFLKSPTGQEVLADKTASSGEHFST